MLVTSSSFAGCLLNKKVHTIESLWAQHIQDGGLRFYSLRWFAEEPGAYEVTFDPSGWIPDKS